MTSITTTSRFPTESAVDEDDPELEKAILTEYHSLLQTRYNDKSALLTEGRIWPWKKSAGREPCF